MLIRVLWLDLLLIVKLNDKKKFVLSGAHSLVGLNLTPLSEPQAGKLCLLDKRREEEEEKAKEANSS